MFDQIIAKCVGHQINDLFFTIPLSLSRYNIMLSCWRMNAELRPTFNDLEDKIYRLLERNIATHYIDLNEPYLKSNVNRLNSGQKEYLKLLDVKVSSSGYVQINGTKSTSSGYVDMKSHKTANVDSQESFV